ncbi:ChaB family protein [Paraburkholderia sp. EG304]|uniref:ChaB family protein n=1 Tax=Paraburkholderia sp. EG304 TaxID=3237015 RepID=UPI003978DEF4
MPTLRAENEVPYFSNADLPESVRDHLPQHAQEIYRAAFKATLNKQLNLRRVGDVEVFRS